MSMMNKFVLFIFSVINYLFKYLTNNMFYILSFISCYHSKTEQTCVANPYLFYEFQGDNLT